MADLAIPLLDGCPGDLEGCFLLLGKYLICMGMPNRIESGAEYLPIQNR